MNNDLKSLFKILAYSFFVFLILTLGFLFAYYFHSIAICEYSGGDWVFNKADKEFCLSLDDNNCNDNPKCVLAITSLSEFKEPICTSRSGCTCNSSWYRWRGCSGEKSSKDRALIGVLFFITFFLFFIFIFILIRKHVKFLIKKSVHPT